jgi:hypothetical protein
MIATPLRTLFVRRDQDKNVLGLQEILKPCTSEEEARSLISSMKEDLESLHKNKEIPFRSYAVFHWNMATVWDHWNPTEK